MSLTLATTADIDRVLAAPGFLADPYPAYTCLRAHSPVYRSEFGPWLISRYEDAERVLRDPRRFSSDPRRAVRGTGPAGQGDGSSPFDRTLGRAMLSRDPPAHTRLRRLVGRAVTRHRIRIRPRVHTIVEALLDKAEAAGRIDMIRDLAYPLPIAVIAEMLGISEADREQVRRLMRAIASGSGQLRLQGRLTAAELEAMDGSAAALIELMTWIVSRRRAHPEDDLVSDLLRVASEGNGMTDDELVGSCLLLLIAGHETTVNLVGNGMLALLRHPEQWDMLVRDSGIAEPAVEELLRYDSPTQMVGRVVVQDVELRGVLLRPGDYVLVLTGSANRDPARFDHPDRLDLRRGSRCHLSFGAVPHFCLGAPLARLEARVAFLAVATRFPSLDAPDGPVRWRPWRPIATQEGVSFGLRGLEALELRL